MSLMHALCFAGIPMTMTGNASMQAGSQMCAWYARAAHDRNTPFHDQGAANEVVAKHLVHACAAARRGRDVVLLEHVQQLLLALLHLRLARAAAPERTSVCPPSRPGTVQYIVAGALVNNTSFQMERINM
jgi:uncharacterized protein YodC (DUF2158 family)